MSANLVITSSPHSPIPTFESPPSHSNSSPISNFHTSLKRSQSTKKFIATNDSSDEENGITSIAQKNISFSAKTSEGEEDLIFEIDDIGSPEPQRAEIKLRQEVSEYDAMLKNNFGIDLCEMIKHCEENPELIESLLLQNCLQIFEKIPENKLGNIPSEIFLKLLNHSHFVVTATPFNNHVILNDLGPQNEWKIYQFIMAWLKYTKELKKLNEKNSIEKRDEFINSFLARFRIGLLNYDELNRIQNEHPLEKHCAVFQQELQNKIEGHCFNKTPSLRCPHPLSIIKGKSELFFENIIEDEEYKITLKIDVSSLNEKDNGYSIKKIFKTSYGKIVYRLSKNNTLKLKVLRNCRFIDDEKNITLKLILPSSGISIEVAKFKSQPFKLSYILELDKIENIESILTDNCLVLEIECTK